MAVEVSEARHRSAHSGREGGDQRQWATKTLRSYIVDGYAINEAWLRDDPAALKELAGKVRALRADEKNIYASIRECFKISASDYDPNAKETRAFHARLQDKFHFAVAGKTASEIILDRADHRQVHTGLKTIKGKVPALDEAKVAKNYLDHDELYALLSIKLDALLETNEYPVFREYKDYLRDHAVAHAQAELKLYVRRLSQEGTAFLPTS